MAEWAIRRYATRDFDDVWRLHREGIEQTTSEYPKVMPGYEDDLLDIDGTYLDDGSDFWVVEATGGELIGMTAISRVDDETARLRRMRVTEVWRRRGVAQALLDHAIAFCQESGYAKVILDSTEHQTAAHQLYERAGFVRTSERTLGPFKVYDYELALG
jgi:GNAT superfamily N-acetyltransferase